MRRAFPVAVALGLLIGPLGGPDGRASAGQTQESILYESTGLKIYRGTTRLGAPAIVLTNLDDEGNVLAGGAGGASDQSRTKPSIDTVVAEPAPADGERAAPEERPEGRVANGVKVLVQHAGDATPLDERNVEVRSDGTGGTTVIINVNTVAPPEKSPQFIPEFGYPMVVQGGIVGPFRYPDRLPFLGYGLKNDTPVYFGGLGFSSTERYARALGRQNDPATDCTKGRGAERP